MNTEEFKGAFRDITKRMVKLMESKNADYTKDSNPFGNFKLVESLGITSIEKGILVRMSDKMSRISTLIDQDAQVKDESIEDTLMDLANYSIILQLYLQNKRDEIVIGVDKGVEDGDKTAVCLMKNGKIVSNMVIDNIELDNKELYNIILGKLKQNE